MAQHTRRLAPEIRAPIEVVPFGVDLAQFQRVRAYEPPAKELRMGIVKKLAPNYGIAEVLRAVALARRPLLSRGIARVHLSVYGDGPQLADLRQLTSSLDLQESVTFFGHVSNESVPQILEGLHLALLGSHRESFGVSAVEALAMGVPVIATDTVGFVEVLAEGESGVIVPSGNVDAMAQAIIRTAMDPDLCLKLSAAGRARVEENYNWKDNVESMTEVYRQVLGIETDE